MTVNVGDADRIIRLVLGVVLLVVPFFGGLALFDVTMATVISVIAGIVLVGTSAIKFCPLYRIFGFRTCKV